MERKDRNHLNLLCSVGELAHLLTGSSNIENFLQQTVKLVANHLKADVCSIYLYEGDTEELVLTATVGLNPAAVGKVRMKLGEGLVGSSLNDFSPVCEGDAFSSPRFKHFKEADEDRFKSFLAVPIQRGVERSGVLVVQHQQTDYFDDLDITALRALSSQLVGSIENARLLMELGGKKEVVNRERNFDEVKFVRGDVGAKGFALGPVTMLKMSKNLLMECESSSDAALSMYDFNRAIQVTKEQLEEFQVGFAERLPESVSLIFAAHFMILKDPGFLNKMRERIEAGESPAEAVRTVARHYIALFSSNSHAYIREKANDVEDLALRLLKNLKSGHASEPSVGKEHIVIAKELYPSDILKLVSNDIKGIILVSGGVTSHVSILSRSLQIPLVIAERPELLNLPEGTRVLLDAEVGNIYVDPTDEVMDQFAAHTRSVASTESKKAEMLDKTLTSDGERVRLLANINLLSELHLARDLKAEGVGLYRTEFPFLIRSTFPSEAEQYIIYKRLLKEMEGKEVTIRTLDVGGEKVLAYSDAIDEINPELGLRSIRFSLRHRDIFEQQIRAILRASACVEKVRLMFPMISSLDELFEAKAIVKGCMAGLKREKLPFHETPSIGMMVELPSVLGTIDDFAREVDFFSIGTNDLIQYMLAVDRANKEVAKYYCPHHPAILRALSTIVEAGNRHGKDVSICGEMAHELEYVPFLMGIGVRTISVDPQFLPPVQNLIAGMSMDEARREAKELLAEPTIQGVGKVLDRHIEARKGDAE